MTDDVLKVLNTSRIERAAIVRTHASCFNKCLKRLQDLKLQLELRGHLTEEELEEMKQKAEEARIHKGRFAEIVQEWQKWI